MTRVQTLFVVLAVWAAVYLPALGSLEIKGEEGRRILPAVQMIETGEYLVPKVGGEPFLRKPPLINWVVAASFKIFGTRNEWTARLPSALCVLAVALVFVTISRASLGAAGSTIAALVWLTDFGMIEKGRLIEIEALYVSLFAIAIVCWLSCWEQKRSAWLTWFVPWIFLGLGWLAKGPLHLLFFYSIMIAVLWRAGELRTIWNLPHLIGLIVMMSIFAAWAIPFAQATGEAHTAQVWGRQFSGRLTQSVDWKNWPLNIPKSLSYFLPWLVFVPLVGSRGQCPRLQPDALIWGIALPLVIVDLIPGSQPRYTMPVIAPFAWLIASILTADHMAWPRWIGGKSFSWTSRRRAVAGLAILTCVSMSIYTFGIVPFLKKRGKIRPIAAQIEAVVPESERLFAVDPDYQPYLFYVRRPIVYVNRVEDLPADARYFLVQPKNVSAAETAQQWAPSSPRPALSLKDYRGKTVLVFVVADH